MAVIMGFVAVLGLLIYHLWLASRLVGHHSLSASLLRVFGLSLISAVMWYVILWLTIMVRNNASWDAYNPVFYFTTGLPALLPYVRYAGLTLGSITINSYSFPLLNLDFTILYFLNFLILVAGLFLLGNLVRLTHKLNWLRVPPSASLRRI